jgi:allophanate hydrolase
VALGAVPFSIGTDTAGSGRVPAALNGIVGLKPTLGRVSLAGIVPAVRRLDCPSVFARSVGGAQVVVAAIAGPDPRDALTRVPTDLRPMRWPPVIGVPAAWPAGVGLSDEMASWFAAAVDRLRAIGATVVEIDIAPALELGAMLYGSAVVAERAAAVGGAVAKGVDGLDPTVASIIADSMLWSAVDAYRAEYRLADLRAAFDATWDGIDVLALPTTAFLPTRAAVRADPIGVNRALGALTTFVNLADAACVVVPMEPGVPAGLQLVARAWRDDELAELAASYVAGALTTPVTDLSIVVVGAHLDGLPLNGQLTERGAWLRRRTTTASTYRLYELAGTVPAKPGLRRVRSGGAAIEVEVWAIGAAELGSFVGQVSAPLGIGTVELADGTWEHGFICEGWALDGARDITDFGGWRAFLRDR